MAIQRDNGTIQSSGHTSMEREEHLLCARSGNIRPEMEVSDVTTRQLSETYAVHDAPATSRPEGFDGEVLALLHLGLIVVLH